MSVPGTNKDSLVSCGTCFREEYVNFQACLQLGWPKCCGYTMRLVTTEANIDKAVTGAIRSQVPAGYPERQEGKHE